MRIQNASANWHVVSHQVQRRLAFLDQITSIYPRWSKSRSGDRDLGLVPTGVAVCDVARTLVEVEMEPPVRISRCHPPLLAGHRVDREPLNLGIMAT